MNFTVNGHTWLLQFVRPSNENLKRSNGSYTFGVTDNNLKTVFIIDSASEYMTDKILVHELAHVHALEYDYSIPLWVEEIVCDFLSLHGRSVIYLADSIMPKILRKIS